MPLTNYIVTGHTGEAHITADDVRTFNAYTLGTADYVIKSNDVLALSIIDNHTVRLGSGDILMQGIHARIPHGYTEQIDLSLGTAGYNRIDLIVARYENTGTIEKVTFEVLEGDSTAGEPEAPIPQSGDILHGDVAHEMPLYKVTFDGNVILSAEPLFTLYMDKVEYLTTKADAIEEELNQKFADIQIEVAEKWEEIDTNITEHLADVDAELEEAIRTLAGTVEGRTGTLLASGWSEAGVYDFTGTYPNSRYDMSIALSSDATKEQIEAWGNAIVLASSDLSNKCVAVGEIPQIDIPIIIRLEVKANA